MTKPATITSPTHSVGVGAIVAVGALALQLLAGIAAPKALGQAIGWNAATIFVPAVMLVAVIGSLMAVVVVPRLPDPARAMRVEAACKASLAVTMLAYAWSLTHVYGWAGGPATQTFAWGLGLAFAVRVVQILRDAHRACRARSAGIVADPVPLGDPGHVEG